MSTDWDSDTVTQSDFDRWHRIGGRALIAFTLILAIPLLRDRMAEVAAGKPSRGITILEPIVGTFLGLSALLAARGSKRPVLHAVLNVLAAVAAASGAAYFYEFLS